MAREYAADHEWRPMDKAAVAALLGDVPALWWLSGGVGLDEFLGYRSRDHADIDVSVARADWPVVYGAVSPFLDVWLAHRGTLQPAADVAVPREIHNIWCRSPDGPWAVQFNLEDVDAGWWSYRRDPRVGRSVAELTWRSEGMRCVNPAVQLLWKSARPRPVDEQDFECVIPRLPTVEISWLAGAVARAHPDSPWAPRISEWSPP